MSQTYTFIAPGALIVSLILLVLSYRAEAGKTNQARARRPLPGKFFIVILLACTFIGMTITEWQGTCRLPLWGFIAGIIPGTAAEIACVLPFREEDKSLPGVMRKPKGWRISGMHDPILKMA
jgi:hypothetical protein